MAERQRHGRPALEVAAEEAIREDATLDGGFGGVLHDGRPVLFRQPEDPLDAPHAGGAVVLVNVRAHQADVRAGRSRHGEEALHGLRGLGRAIAVGNAMPPAFGAQMLAQ